MHRTGTGPRLATDDDPVEVRGHLAEVDGAEERLGGDEPYGGRGVQQRGDANLGPLLVLDAHTKPDVRRWPGLPWVVRTDVDALVRQRGRLGFDHLAKVRVGQQAAHPGM